MSSRERTTFPDVRRVLALGRGAGLTDAELLERFALRHDQAAFEVLAWRHAGLVYSACRRVLRNRQDVDDAFQATFLVFVRKCRSIRRHELLGSWLYRVAYRIALRARAAADRRAAAERAHREVPEFAEPSEPSVSDLRRVLDEELNRLPARYRDPLVLCYLEGVTKEEAARRLGCPAGTVSSRLARGRERLRARLTRRGLALTTAAVAAGLERCSADALPPAAVVRSAVTAILPLKAGETAAPACVTADAAALAKGATRDMLKTKWKWAACLLLTLGVAGGSAATVLRPPPAAPPRAAAPDRPAASTPQSRDGASEDPDPARGRRWEIAPRPVAASRSDVSGYFTSDTVLGIYGKDAGGALVVALSYPLRGEAANVPRYRPVAFDAEGNRYPFKIGSALFNKDIASVQYRLDPATVPSGKITRVGVQDGS